MSILPLQVGYLLSSLKRLKTSGTYIKLGKYMEISTTTLSLSMLLLLLK
jgi:hypothetical protein